MGGRVTRSAQSRELLRAKSLHQALECGASPSFIPTGSPTAAQPSSLSWNPAESNPSVTTEQDPLDLRRQYLEQLFQNSPDSLVVVDSSFHAQAVNREFQRVFGYSEAQILSQPIDSLILPPDRAAEAQWIAQCLQRGEQLSLETQRRHRDGTLLDVSLSTAPLIVNGRSAAYYFVYRDISDRKRAETLNSALFNVAEKACSTQDLQQFFAAIHGIVDELMPARNFSIAIHDPESQLLSFPYFVDEQESAPAPARAARGLVEYVLRTGEPLLCTPELLRQMQKRREIELFGPSPLYLAGCSASRQSSRLRRPHPQKLLRKNSSSRARQGSAHSNLASVGRHHRAQTQRAGSAPLRSSLPVSRSDRGLRNLSCPS